MVRLDSTCVKAYPDGMNTLKKVVLSQLGEHRVEGTSKFIWSSSYLGNCRNEMEKEAHHSAVLIWQPLATQGSASDYNDYIIKCKIIQYLCNNLENI